MKILNAVSVVVCLFTLTCYAGTSNTYLPKWEVGDKWEVSTYPILESEPAKPGGVIRRRSNTPIVYNYTVTELKEVEGEICFVVEASSKSDDTSYRIYVRKESFTLKKFFKIMKDETGLDITAGTDNKRADTFFILDTPGGIPWDFPKFPDAEANEERLIQHTDGNKKIKQITTFDSSNSKMTIELSTTNNSKEVRVVYIWCKGDKWWSSAIKKYDNVEFENGELTRK